MSMFLEINRRKPQIINEFNRRHVKLIWSDQHRKQLKIPQVINNYTHWIMGVDVVNSLYTTTVLRFGVIARGCQFFSIALIFYYGSLIFYYG